MRIAVIGTAGRDKSKPMTRKTWDWMLDQAYSLCPTDATLVSGGAAWADHIAVQLYLSGHVSSLILHLPAKLNDRGFIGPYRSSASAANYYHQQFSQAIGVNCIQQLIDCCTSENCTGSVQPPSPGFSAMFARNKLVVADLDPITDGMLAFTFGSGSVADGGTKHTWDMFVSDNKKHIQIPIF